LDNYQIGEYHYQSMAENLQPPSYSIAKVEDALSQISDLNNITLVLDENKVKLQDQNDDIYCLSENPRLSKAETFTFAVQTYTVRENNPTGPKSRRQKELYTVKEAYNWINPAQKAFFPPMYTFTADARSFFCFTSGCELVKGNANWLIVSPLIPFSSIKNHLGSWRLRVNIKGDGKQQSLMLFRRRDRHDQSKHLWMDANRILALETTASTSLHKPTLELKSSDYDRRIIHVLVLAWVTIIWHDAKEEYVKDKANEIAKTLTCKRIITTNLSLS
jgi:hypothetical protein